MKHLAYIAFISLLMPYCVIFNLDLNSFNDYPDGDWVARANGSWNGWGTGIDLYDDDGDGIYSVTDCSFENDEYQYVFAITGDFDNWSNWGMTGNPPMLGDCDYNPFDSYPNYGFQIQDNDIELQTHSWNCCGVDDCDSWEGCTAGSMRTDQSYLYGRFEVRMKSVDSDGVVSSFFTYNTDWESNLGNLNWNEIDIEMTGNRDSSVQFTTHHPGDPNSWSYGEIIEVGFNPHQDFHDYAFEWTPQYIKWFVDGEEVYQQSESVVDDLNLSQKIMMNVWPAIWSDWVGEWSNQDTPQHVYYDYVRYYAYSPGYGDYGTDSNFELIWQDDFDVFDESIWDDNSFGSFNGNLCEFNPSNTNYYNGHLILTLSDSSDILNCDEVFGDVNHDSELNVIDIILIIDVINYSLNTLDICQELAIDTDFNQNINVLDIVYLVGHILDR